MYQRIRALVGDRCEELLHGPRASAAGRTPAREDGVSLAASEDSKRGVIPRRSWPNSNCLRTIEVATSQKEFLLVTCHRERSEGRGLGAFRPGGTGNSQRREVGRLPGGRRGEAGRKFAAKRGIHPARDAI